MAKNPGIISTTQDAITDVARTGIEGARSIAGSANGSANQVSQNGPRQPIDRGAADRALVDHAGDGKVHLADRRAAQANQRADCGVSARVAALARRSREFNVDDENRSEVTRGAVNGHA